MDNVASVVVSVDSVVSFVDADDGFVVDLTVAMRRWGEYLLIYSFIYFL